jgi:hypothetical protein
LESFLENNPNAKGHEQQFVFAFQYEEAETQKVEVVEDSWQPPKKG